MNNSYDWKTDPRLMEAERESRRDFAVTLGIVAGLFLLLIWLLR